MERKPRPLNQPVLSRAQWVRVAFLGILMAIGTLTMEAWFWGQGPAVGVTIALVAFSLFNIVLGLSCRSETDSAFNRDIFSDRTQLLLYGLSLLLTFLPTEIGFLQRFLGTTSLTLNQWLLCIGLAFGLLLADEVIKLFLRRRRGKGEAKPSGSVQAPAVASAAA
jgi:Ca2+-transporting ATPase